MTKISQLADIGTGLAAADEFVIRDVSDASTPNKKVTASGFFALASALGFTGFDLISAGVSGESRVQVFASGISGRTDTTISGVVVARTTISGYFENASGVPSGVLFPVVTQSDIGTAPNQVPVNGMLGSMAYQDAALASVDRIVVTSGIANATGTVIAIPTSDNYLRMPSGTSGIQFNGDTLAVNALNDYEEGNFTPVAIGKTSAGTGTYVANGQIGRYTKIGNIVHFTIRVGWNAHTGTGNLAITGLPFASANVSGVQHTTVIFPSNLAMTASNTAFTLIDTNATEILLYQNPAGGGTSTNIPMDTDTVISISGSYRVS